MIQNILALYSSVHLESYKLGRTLIKAYNSESKKKHVLDTKHLLKTAGVVKFRKSYVPSKLKKQKKERQHKYDIQFKDLSFTIKKLKSNFIIRVSGLELTKKQEKIWNPSISNTECANINEVWSYIFTSLEKYKI